MQPEMRQTLAELLGADGWVLRELPGSEGLATTVKTEANSWSMMLLGADDERVISCYSLLPSVVPEAGRAAVAEGLTRLNYGLLVGAFELDLDDGEVRCRTSIDFVDEAVNPSLLRALVGRNVAMAERYFPTIIAIGAGRASPNALGDAG
jgi:hypothetical protein